MTIAEKLEQIYKLMGDRNNATKELREKVMELERQSDAISEPYDDKIGKLRDEIVQEIINSGESYDNDLACISYKQGRVIEPTVSINWKMN